MSFKRTFEASISMLARLSRWHERLSLARSLLLSVGCNLFCFILGHYPLPADGALGAMGPFRPQIREIFPCGRLPPA